jgi:hypothetical protein
VGEYYARRRAIPMRNICRIRTALDEDIPRAKYGTEIAAPIARGSRDVGLRDHDRVRLHQRAHL